MITQRQVKPGCQVTFTRALVEFVAFARKFSGHLGIRVLTRIKGGREYFAVVDHFVNSAARCAFTSSPEFALWLSALRATTWEIPDLRGAENTRNPDPTGTISTDCPDWPVRRPRLFRWLYEAVKGAAQTLQRLKCRVSSRG